MGGATTMTSGRTRLEAIATGGVPRPPAADERYANPLPQVVHLGRSQANATAEIRSPDGHLHVTALATCRVRT